MNLTHEQGMADNLCRRLAQDTLSQYAGMNLPPKDLQQSLIAKVEHASIRLRESGQTKIADALEETFIIHGANYWLLEIQQ